MARLLLQDLRLPDRAETVDILLVDGVIERVEQGIPESSADHSRDCAGLVALPGAIDIHVHFRIPGGDAKEDWAHGSAAALAGGVTTVFDMPNTDPPTTTVSRLLEKIARITPDAGVDFGCYLGATNDNLADIEAAGDRACGVKVYYGSTTGDLLCNDPGVLRRLLELRLPHPIVFHAEDESVIAYQTEQHRRDPLPNPKLHSLLRPREAASNALRQIIELVAATNGKAHITHITTREEVALMGAAKERGLDISCDVTPHHLAFTEEDLVEQGNRLRVNPPLRTQADIDALWQGLVDGTIDLVASDHAPHTWTEKSHRDYWSVPSGVPGVETLLPFLLDNLSAEFSLQRLVEVTSTKAAERFGLLTKGKVAEGFLADLVLVDLAGQTLVENQAMHSKAAWTPFAGQVFTGSIQAVYRRGELAFQR